MKKLLLTLALLSFANSAMACELKRLNFSNSWSDVNEYCLCGVVYYGYGQSITLKLLPSGKPATCNY